MTTEINFRIFVIINPIDLLDENRECSSYSLYFASKLGQPSKLRLNESDLNGNRYFSLRFPSYVDYICSCSMKILVNFAINTNNNKYLSWPTRIYVNFENIYNSLNNHLIEYSRRKSFSEFFLLFAIFLYISCIGILF